MPWALFAQLIVQEGLPLAEKLYQKWTSGKEVTQDDIDDLKTIKAQTAQTHLQRVADLLGLPTSDPRITALQTLIQ